MSGVELALATVAVGVGALVQGSVGFGLNLIAAPLLALIDHDLVPGPALACAFVLTILITVRERRAVEWRGIGWAFTGRVPGTLLAAVAIASLPERGLAIFFALLVLFGVLISLVRWHPRPTPATLLGAGAVSGFMGTATSIGGPPMALVYQRLGGASLRGTLSGYFVLGSILSIGVLAAVGEFGAEQLRATAVLVPGVVAGFLLSRFTSGYIDDRGAARAAILWVSALSAVALLLDQLFSG